MHLPFPRLAALALLTLAPLAAAAQGDDSPKSLVRVVDSDGKVKYVAELDATIRNDLPVAVHSVTLLVKFSDAGGSSEMHRLERPVEIAPGAQSSISLRVDTRMRAKSVDSFSIDVVDARFDVDVAALEALARSDSALDERMLLSAVGALPWVPGAAERLAKSRADAALMAAVRAPLTAIPAPDAVPDDYEARLVTAARLLAALGGPDDVALVGKVLVSGAVEDPWDSLQLGLLVRAIAPDDGPSRLLAVVGESESVDAEFLASALLVAWPDPAALAKACGTLAPAVAKRFAASESGAWLLATLSAQGSNEAKAALATVAVEVVEEALLAPPGNVRADHAREVLTASLATRPKADAKALRELLARPVEPKETDGDATDGSPLEVFGNKMPVDRFRLYAAATATVDADRLPFARGAVDSLARQAEEALPDVLSLVARARIALAHASADPQALQASSERLIGAFTSATDAAAGGWAAGEVAKLAGGDAAARVASGLVARARDASDPEPLLALATSIDPANTSVEKFRTDRKSAETQVERMLFVAVVLAGLGLWFTASHGRNAKRAGVCQSCGREGDVLDQKYRYNIGLLVARRTGEWGGDVCKPCGLKKSLAYCLTLVFLGWWGLISFIVTPIFLLLNVVNAVRTFHLESPRGPPVAPMHDLAGPSPDETAT